MAKNSEDNHKTNQKASETGCTIMTMLADYGDMKMSLVRFEEQLMALAAMYGVPVA